MGQGCAARQYKQILGESIEYMKCVQPLSKFVGLSVPRGLLGERPRVMRGADWLAGSGGRHEHKANILGTAACKYTRQIWSTGYCRRWMHAGATAECVLSHCCQRRRCCKDVCACRWEHTPQCSSLLGGPALELAVRPFRVLRAPHCALSTATHASRCVLQCKSSAVAVTRAPRGAHTARPVM
jgi:hypothetical protein